MELAALPVRTIPTRVSIDAELRPVTVETTRTGVAFEAFYRAEIEGLVRALTATLGDVGLAQDAAQEAMLRACSKWESISTYDNPFGWTYRVGLNWATSRWRRRKREHLTGAIDPSTMTSEFETVDPVVLDAVLSMPVDWRAVIVLRLWMDWSIEDTAAALQIPKGTVRSRTTRAVKHLRVVLDDRDVRSEHV